MNADRRRWANLVDRETSGEALSADEAAFCRDLERRDPLCAREAALLAALGEDDGDDLAARALVDRVLAADEARARTAAGSSAPFEPKQPRRWPRAIVGTALALAGAAALVVGLTRPQPMPPPVAASRAELVFRAGVVAIARARGEAPPQGGAVAPLLGEGDVVAVGAGRACVAIDPGVHVCAEADTRMRIVALAGAARVVAVDQGEVRAALAPQPPGSSFAIRADELTVRAVGTAFVVSRPSASKGAAIAVMEGKVELEGPRGKWIVPADTRVTVASDGTAATERLGRTESSAAWGTLALRPLWSAERSATLAAVGAAGATVWIDGRALGALPVRSLIPAGQHEIELHRGGEPAERRTVHAEAGSLVELELPATAPTERVERHRPTARRAPAPPTVGPSPGELLEEARSFVGRGELARAARGYERLVREHPASPEAHTALVSLGLLELDRLGDPGRALGRFDRYLARGGPVAEEAASGRIRALRALGDRAAERQAIERSLAAYPRSPEARRWQERLRELEARPPAP